MDESRGVASLEAWTRPRPWIADGLLAVVLAGVLLPASVDVVVSSEWPPAVRAVAIGTLGLVHLSVALRRLLPRGAFLAACGAMLALVAVPDADGTAIRAAYGTAVPLVLVPSSLVFCVLMYSVAAARPAVDALRALAIGAVGAVLTTARLWSVEVASLVELGAVVWRSLVLLTVVAVVAVPWQLGRLRYLRGQYQAALADRARQEERQRIARELHDVVSHSLAVMVSQAEGARMMMARDREVVAPALERIATTGQDAMRGMRGLLDALDPDTGERAPQPSLADLGALIENARGAGLVTHYAGEPPPEVEPSVGLVAYRVVQEALTNVLKHVGAGAEVEVDLVEAAGALEVRVRDDGGPGLAPAPGRGLTGMRERVEALDGDLEAAAGERGFVVIARIPTRRGT
ncbi:sensor histidine kinase [Aeromicrobium sp. YIM 150415]|uniref:sensor histidine kinase n=1 Tax=Aeromicrobium sp. YIM 150415 TaxID=2803912 RepID=UPI0019649309|nr:histidine kinase [Aeromicrobium sp. YIM 150415]MBM9464600.1 sensor histidine kinase [Aeromicrobium sp. YIM 150415]